MTSRKQATQGPARGGDATRPTRGRTDSRTSPAAQPNARTAEPGPRKAGARKADAGNTAKASARQPRGKPSTDAQATTKPATGRKSTDTPPIDTTPQAATTGPAPRRRAPAPPAAGAGTDDDPTPAAARPRLDVDPEVLEFIAAIDAYKRQHGRAFPTWSEVLHVVRELGYVKRA